MIFQAENLVLLGYYISFQEQYNRDVIVLYRTYETGGFGYIL